MEIVHTLDIDGSQWEMQDLEARNKIAVLEEKTSANFDYSLNEKVIGTWVDGKQLYRLVIQGNSTNRIVAIDLSDRNIKEITKIDGVFNASDRYIMPFPNYLARNSSQLGNIYAYVIYNINTKKIEITFGNAGYYSSVKATLQIEYTKNK